MLSALNPGSLVYILDKAGVPKYKVGKLVSSTSPKSAFNAYGGIDYTQNTVDLKVEIEGNVYEYNAIPSSSAVITYNNGKVIVSETPQGLLTEVETMHNEFKNILDNKQYYEESLAACKDIMKELSPQYAKDQERDDKLSNLELRIDNVDSKLTQILNLVTNSKQ